MQSATPRNTSFESTMTTRAISPTGNWPAIRESQGLVGVTFATSYLRSDGGRDADTTADLILKHVDHVLEHVGEDGIGFGSDFDGAKMPAGLGSAAELANDRAIAAQPRVWRTSDRKTALQKLAEGIEKNLGTWTQPWEEGGGEVDRYRKQALHILNGTGGAQHHGEPPCRPGPRWSGLAQRHTPYNMGARAVT
jgi:hypothetical protein